VTGRGTLRLAGDVEGAVGREPSFPVSPARGAFGQQGSERPSALVSPSKALLGTRPTKV